MSITTTAQAIWNGLRLSREEFAHRMGLSETEAASYENQITSEFKTLYKISEVFNTTPNEVLGIESKELLQCRSELQTLKECKALMMEKIASMEKELDELYAQNKRMLDILRTKEAINKEYQDKNSSFKD